MDLENRKIHTRDNVTSNSYFLLLLKNKNCKSEGRKKNPIPPTVILCKPKQTKWFKNLLKISMYGNTLRA